MILIVKLNSNLLVKFDTYSQTLNTSVNSSSNVKNQGQFLNPHHERIPKLFLILEFVLELTEKFKIKDIT